MDGDWIIPGYRHIRILGEGMSGRVVQAEHLETATPVAIKYLSPRLVRDEGFLSRFRAEARLLGDLHDPYLVRFHEYVEGPQGAAIVMELVDGVSLAVLLEAEGPTQPEAALTVLKGSLLGLATAHAAGVVHRDYKPGNVLVRADGASLLADFGVAVRAGDSVPTAGTPAYMAPEQWGGGPVSPASDVYAATAVFYECLTGERPYPARAIPQLAMAHRTADIPAYRVPEPLRGLVEHGLAKNPEERPQSARTFLGELEALAFGAYGIGWEERGRGQLKERVALLALLFPAGRSADVAATSVGLTDLDEDPGDHDGGHRVHAGHGMAGAPGRKRGGRKAGMAAAAAAVGLLLIGGGATAVYVANSGSDAPLADGTVSPSAGPSDDPSGEPSENPSASPTASKDSPTPSPTPSTATPSAKASGGSTVNAAPNPASSTTKATAKPDKPVSAKPTPFKVTAVTVTVSRTARTTTGSFTVRLSTQGAPTSPVPVTIAVSRGVQSGGPSTLTLLPPSYTQTFSLGSGCQRGSWTWQVTAAAAGISDTDDTSGPTFSQDRCG